MDIFAILKVQILTIIRVANNYICPNVIKENNFRCPLGLKHQKTKVPTTNVVKGIVKLSSSSVLMGCDSTSVAATETTRKPRAMRQVSSIKPKVWK
jgi:hypothetical protein